VAISRGATISQTKITAATSSGDISHTVDTETTLLIVYIGLEAGEDVSGTPQWSLGGGENLTLIHETTASGSNNDCRSFFFGLINPTAGAGTVTINFTSNVNPGWTCAVNYLNTVSTSVAAATNFLDDDVNDTGTSQFRYTTSLGTISNALVCGGHAQGQDTSPMAPNQAFTEVFDTTTGPSNSADFGVWFGELFSELPSGLTVNMSATDENCSIIIELVAIFVPATQNPALTRFKSKIIMRYY